MEKFQDLLTEAAQLKQQQLKQQRKNFEALPQYLKSGLNYAKKYIQLRKQHYLVQKYISQKLKIQGNDQYKLQNYAQALRKYQQALSVFRYIHAKKYENLKDEDIIYENYVPQPQYKEQHEGHLVALYLNICSALTKMNKRDEALHSSQQAMKINENNAKIYYKKAQAHLQYINREQTDIKLGFFYLNKAYELSKDQSVLAQMYKIKKELDEERQKSKKCFKFMFDKNKTFQNEEKSQGKEQNTILNQQSISFKKLGESELQGKFKQQFAKFRQQNQQQHNNNRTQHQKSQKRIQFLRPYLIIPRDDRWLIKYQQDFIHKHGSKIYSILQLYNYSDYLVEFKSLLAKCLELKQALITAQRDESKILQEKTLNYAKFIEWLKKHPIDKLKKYIERYHLQTQWIKENRGKPLDEVFPKESNLTQSLNSDKFERKLKQKDTEMPPKQESKQQKKDQALIKTKQKSQSINVFKQEDQVPAKFKGFLQNYESFTSQQVKSPQTQSKSSSQKSHLEHNVENAKNNPFSFVQTFIVILIIVLLTKFVF